MNTAISYTSVPSQVTQRRAQRRLGDFAISAFFIIKETKLRHVYCRVANLSSRGLNVIVEKSDYEFLPAMTVSIRCDFPPRGPVILECDIAHVKSTGDVQVIGLRLRANNKASAYLAAAGNYLACNHGDKFSFSEIRAAGFKIGDVSAALSTALRTANNLDEILDLRLKAWQADGEFKDATVEQMRDRFDDHTRHVAIKLGGRCIGAIRVVSNDGDTSKMESLHYGFTLPQWILTDGFAEASRAAVHPDYRSSEVFLRLLYEAGKALIEDEKKYCVLNCHPKLVDIYKAIGFRKLPGCASDNAVLMYTNFSDVVRKSSYVSVAGWALVLSDLRRELIRTKKLEPSLFPTAYLMIKEILKPFILLHRKHRNNISLLRFRRG